MTKTTLKLFQLSWSARDYEPDGSPYATEDEAQAARANAARELLEPYSGEDIATAITESVHADEVSDERLAIIRAMTGGDDDGDLTDDEAIIAAVELMDFESAVYPTSITFETAALLKTIKGTEDFVTAGCYLESGVVAAKLVVDRWSSGDLAGAVNGLEAWADDVAGDFPDLDFSYDEDDDDEEDAEGGE